jgi:Peptidase family M28
MVCEVFDGRIYRAALVPLLFALVIAGFSVSGRPAPLSSTLAPDAFDGARAFAELRSLAARFPDRRPASAGDAALARYLAHAIAAAVGGAGGGFQVTTRTVKAQTIDGERTLQTVIAERTGSTGEAPIVLLAHRDAAKRGSQAELSATAALLELARVFAHSETRRTIVLVSTSGGSGGYGGTADFAVAGPGLPVAPDAAIVLGDLAGTGAHKPFLLPFSANATAAPDPLVRTLAGAIAQEVGVRAGDPGLGVQLAHLAAPLSTGEQAPLDAAGMPAVLVQVDGERGPSANEPVSQARLQSFGRAVLSAVYALDEGHDVGGDIGARLLLSRKTLPSWAVRLVGLALLLAPLLACVDALARLRRRGERLGRWLTWVAGCAAPFAVVALFAILIGRLGLVAAPAGQLPASSLSADGSARAALIAVVLVAALALGALPALVRRLSLPLRPSADGAGLAAMLVLLGVSVLTWLVNPFAVLLLAPAANLWLLACEPGARPRPLAWGALALGLVPLVLVALVYAHTLALGPGALAESVVLALAGGQVGPFAALPWSVALGCLLALALLLRGRVVAEPPGGQAADGGRVTTRGPLTYAGPGSLGGTESALRR